MIPQWLQRAREAVDGRTPKANSGLTAFPTYQAIDEETLKSCLRSAQQRVLLLTAHARGATSDDVEYLRIVHLTTAQRLALRRESFAIIADIRAELRRRAIY